MDITETLAPNSDQLDNVDLIAGSRTFTVERVEVRPGAEQPVNVFFAEFPRPWRPGKTMRRILAACWSPESSTWTGKRVELFRDPDVKFGRDTPGGTRIRAVSHIDGTKKLILPTSKGKVGEFIVEPLPAGPQLITDKQADNFLDTIHKAQDQAALSEIGKQLKTFDLGVYKVELQTAWSARSAELKPPVQGAIDDQEQPS